MPVEITILLGSGRVPRARSLRLEHLERLSKRLTGAGSPSAINEPARPGRPPPRGAWLGWQIESNWADPFMFVVYAVMRPLAPR